MSIRHSAYLLAFLIIGLFIITIASFAQEEALTAEDRLLIWMGTGLSPSQADDAGQLVLMQADGSMETLLDLPALTQHVVECAQSDDPLALYVGRERGILYQLTDPDVEALQIINDDVHQAVCMGYQNLQYSPDRSHLAYLDYDGTFITATSPQATLHIASTDTPDEQTTFTQTASFMFHDNDVLFMQYTLNDRGEAIESIINQQDGDNTREITTISADEDCYFNSASLNSTDEQILALMGHRCTRGDTRTFWRLYNIDIESGGTGLIASEVAAGGFSPIASINTVIISPDQERAYFTVPDGLSNNSVSVNMVSIADRTVEAVIDRYARMPLNTSRTYFTNNHFPVLSSNGQFLALTRQDANNNAFLNVIDMAAPDLPPVELSAGERNDIINDILFTPDNRQIIFIAGDAYTGTNAIYNLNPISGGDYRVSRGKYAQGIMSPDGTHIAVMNAVEVEDEAPYMTLSLLNLDNSDTTILYEGVEFDEEEEIVERTFIYPVAWLR